MPKVKISDEKYAEIKKYLEGHMYYKDDFTIDEFIDSIVSMGWFAYTHDGFDGSAHPKKGGDFGINC